ncbi:MAG: hypothetical protein J5691_01510 [Bacilli bacterium]|nr:hypothetical protein [Bacilli bacterium]
MVFDLKAKIIAGLGIILVIGTLFALWRTTSIKLENTREQLNEVTCQLDTVTKENQKLTEYNKRKDKEIKDLNKAYQDQLAKIPADACGDLKPSKELLEFFKEGR